VCLSSPNPPKPPPPAPPLPNKTATKVATDPAQLAAQKLAAQLGTQQLLIPFESINVPA
jgi:hypothetical protein